ncbi:hypothetical protein [Streptomyces sp. NPDC008121]|uniref:hypothetical protein n=1 Tax=Streptomyces sp. NPDC008121 TaxID=3364809 RepID=UPI0036E3128C
MPQSPQYVAQLWMENEWLTLHTMKAGRFPEGDRALSFGPVEKAALPEVKRLLSSFLFEHVHEPLLVVTGSGNREYLCGPGQVSLLRFVLWE